MKKTIALAALFLLPLSVLAAPEFQPLTDIPAVRDFQADGFAAFFNQLYVLCVGAAAVIAVLQFIRAGVYYSLTDTGVTEKREARHMMVMSVTGLILVLSPTIVFGIINPDILKLKIGLESLNLSPVDRVDGPLPANATCDSLPSIWALDREPSSGETWSPTSSNASFYGQCCTSIGKMPSGSTCQVTTTSVGKGNYCRCTSIVSKWHLADGAADTGGIIVRISAEGKSPACFLAATEDSSQFFDTRDACETSYKDPAKLLTLIRGGILRPFYDPRDDNACIKVVERVKAGVSAQVKLEDGPVCFQRKQNKQ